MAGKAEQLAGGSPSARHHPEFAPRKLNPLTYRVALAKLVDELLPLQQLRILIGIRCCPDQIVELREPAQSVRQRQRIESQRDQRQHGDAIALEFKFLQPVLITAREHRLEVPQKIIVTNFVRHERLQLGC